MNVVRLCLALTAFLLTTGPSLADDILGTWLRDNGSMQVKFGPCGDAICGNIVWVKPGSDLKAKVGQRLFFDMRIIALLGNRDKVLRAWPSFFNKSFDGIPG